MGVCHRCEEDRPEVVARNELCKRCFREEWGDDEDAEECHHCGGTGEIDLGDDDTPDVWECDYCNGDGFL